MHIEEVFVKGLNKNILFYIGKKQSDNFHVIDLGKSNDLWFHIKDISSSHVVSVIPNDISKKELKYIIKQGALLCKKNTNKVKSLKNIEIIYTEIQNVTKTDIDGRVIAEKTKTIVV